MPNWRKLVVSGSDANLSNLNVDSAVTASFFKGDGSALTNITSTVVETATVTDSFTSQTSVVVNHNFGTRNILVSVYDNIFNQIIPASVVLTDTDNVTIGFDNPTSGTVVVAKGGHVVSGSSNNTSNLEGQPGSYYLDYNNLTNIPSNLISASGNFTGNEIIIANGNNSVTSSNILSIDPSNNYIGINQSNPEVTLHMTGEDAQTAQIRMEQYNNSADAPDIRTRKARGTAASPSVNNAGDYLFRQNVEAYSGSGWITMHSQQFDLDPGDVNKGVYQLQTNIGSGLTTRLQILNTGDTAINGHLLPTSHEVFDLGSSSKRWRDLYLSGSTIDLGGTKITRDSSTGDIEFKDAGGTRKSLKVDELILGTGATQKNLNKQR